MWDDCGMSRTAAGLESAIQKIRALREEYWRDVKVAGAALEINQSLEKAGRVADFFELAELMCLDAVNRDESCGGHFREEHATPDGEALRDDKNFSYVAAWEYTGPNELPQLNKEPLTFEYRNPLPKKLQMTPPTRAAHHTHTLVSTHTPLSTHSVPSTNTLASTHSFPSHPRSNEPRPKGSRSILQPPQLALHLLIRGQSPRA